MNLLNLTSTAFGFMLIIWAGLALTQGHYYGDIGVALNWFVMGLGILVLAVRFGYVGYFKPPFIYLYVGFFVFMFIREMKWAGIG